MRAKNGRIWNHASAGSCSTRYWTRIADPSTNVIAAARQPMSHSSFVRSVLVVGIASSFQLPASGWELVDLRQLADQIEDRHVHRDDDAADDAAEDGDHQGLHQRQQ